MYGVRDGALMVPLLCTAGCSHYKPARSGALHGVCKADKPTDGRQSGPGGYRAVSVNESGHSLCHKPDMREFEERLL